MLFALLLLAAIPAGAQLQSVEIKVSGLDCASCAESIHRKLSRMRGVESAGFDAATGIASLKLKPENTVTLTTIRDALKSMGYTPQEAEVIVRGDLRDGILSMKHQERAFLVDSPNQVGAVTLTGKVPSPKPGETDRLYLK